VDARVRRYQAEDLEPIVALSLRAWAPVFASLEEALGGELFTRLRGDWRQGQSAAVRQVLEEETVRAWMAEADDRVAGFAAATLHPKSQIGEIAMIAVEPDLQGAGIGTALLKTATEWLSDAGMSVAMVETGGDPGHLPARTTFDKAGFTPLAVARFFKAL
jgi:GNAT superfamily N-acetyltransferase